MEINKYTIDKITEGISYEIEQIITEDKVLEFAKFTNDFHPLHTDVTYAQSKGFRNIMAHGLLLSSYSSAIIGMKLPGENAIIISQSFKYKKPAFVGDILKIKGVVASIDYRFSAVNIKIRIQNQDETIIAEGKYLVKIRK